MKLQKIAPSATMTTLANGDIQLYSYETLVAGVVGDRLYETETKYSRTTNKHIAIFKQQIPNREVVKISQDELNSL